METRTLGWLETVFFYQRLLLCLRTRIPLPMPVFGACGVGRVACFCFSVELEEISTLHVECVREEGTGCIEAPSVPQAYGF